ncbi:unnamed protein product, partial [Musa textilis]
CLPLCSRREQTRPASSSATASPTAFGCGRAEAHGVARIRWPQKGTVEYYASLARHDRALRGRSLALADGNAAFPEQNLEFLYYAVVPLGTPKKHFLVALNTENGWFWVPCDCLQYAPTSNPIKYGVSLSSPFGLNHVAAKRDLHVYSPTNSSTSRSVLCSDSICGNTCPGSNATCPYSVDYLYANTSSSGPLVSDALYLVTDDAAQQPVKAPVVFGCGRNQRRAARHFRPHRRAGARPRGDGRPQRLGSRRTRPGFLLPLLRSRRRWQTRLRRQRRRRATKNSVEHGRQLFLQHQLHWNSGRESFDGSEFYCRRRLRCGLHVPERCNLHNTHQQPLTTIFFSSSAVPCPSAGHPSQARPKSSLRVLLRCQCLD